MESKFGSVIIDKLCSVFKDKDYEENFYYLDSDISCLLCPVLMFLERGCDTGGQEVNRFHWPTHPGSSSKGGHTQVREILGVYFLKKRQKESV